MAEESKSRGDRLARYRAKRSADQSPEPFGKHGDEYPGVFVMQKHAARRLHYDLRLEIDGVLHSWAVPHGPSLDPADKRLAVNTEEHPLDYFDFEGVIPAGNYGAGAMIVWDRGSWTSHGDPAEGLEKGKLLFDLHGHKLRGRWTLVRTKGQSRGGKRETSNEWLLIKKVDGFSRTDSPTSFAPESILSGLTVEQLRDGASRRDEIVERLEELGAPRTEVEASAVKPMLAETAEGSFSDDDWIVELKYDGYRLIGARKGTDIDLFYRRGSKATSVFPDVVRVLRGLPYQRFIIDGEVVVLEDDGRSSFQKLQKRVQLTRRRDVEKATVELPAVMYAFDLLSFEDFDLRPLATVERKEILAMMLPSAGNLRLSDHVEGSLGEAFFAQVEARGLEGVIAKRADAPYVMRRSGNWLKVRVDRTDDFAIVGFTPPKGGRTGFGALHLAIRDGAGYRYRGRVGTGFSDQQLAEIRAELDEHSAGTATCDGAPRGKSHRWVEPTLVAEVRYREITDDGLLRQPVFLRLRDDKEPEDCVGTTLEHEDEPPESGSHAAVATAQGGDAGASGDAREVEVEAELEDDGASERVVNLSNLKKVFWPDQGYTKGDLIDFYRAVSPWILEYLRDRPVVLTRYPDGIDGKNFFQKDAPHFVPGWVRLERMWSEHAQREIDYFVVDEPETLAYLANLATIPLHIWSSRIATLQHPDWCILDLDPKGADFGDVVRIALALRELCNDMGIEPFIKTSGSTGLHVLVPLGRQCTFEQSRGLGELMAKVVAHDMPDIATTVRQVGRRGGRVYIDYLQNGHGRLLASPLSVRPRPGATVSTPLRWDEVEAGLDPDVFTIKTVPQRLERLGDPVRPVLDVVPDLPTALAKLGERLQQQ